MRWKHSVCELIWLIWFGRVIMLSGGTIVTIHHEYVNVTNLELTCTVVSDVHKSVGFYEVSTEKSSKILAVGGSKNECHVTPSPPPKHMHCHCIDANNTRCTLTGLTSADEGKGWQCSVPDGNVAKFSEIVRIKLPDVGGITQEKIINLTHAEKTEVSFECHMRGDQHIKWFKNKQELPMAHSSYILNLTLTRNLTRLHCEEGDQKIQTWNLNVLYPPKVLPMKNVTINEHEPIHTNCSFEVGNPEHTKVKWTSNGVVYSNSISMVISNTSRNQSGVYTCTVSNGEHTVSNEEHAFQGNDAGSFSLNVQYPPSTPVILIDGHVVSQNVTRMENKSITFNCSGNGNPLPHMRLTQSGSKSKIKEGGLNAYFEIDRLSYTDTGLYSCFASNAVGSSSVDMYLNVQSPVRINPNTKHEYITRQSDGANLTFDGLANPIPRVEDFKWFKCTTNHSQCLPITTDGRRNIVTHGVMSRLTIQPLTEVDFGIYRLEVRNGIGQACIYDFVLNARDKPYVPKHFRVLDDSIMENSVQLGWVPGFDGGLEQTFHVLYTPSSQADWKQINIIRNNTVGHTENMTTVVQGLEPGKEYVANLFASNDLGNSSVVGPVAFRTLELVTIQIVPDNGVPKMIAPLIVGIVVVTCVVAALVFREKLSQLRKHVLEQSFIPERSEEREMRRLADVKQLSENVYSDPAESQKRSCSRGLKLSRASGKSDEPFESCAAPNITVDRSSLDRVANITSKDESHYAECGSEETKDAKSKGSKNLMNMKRPSNCDANCIPGRSNPIEVTSTDTEAEEVHYVECSIEDKEKHSNRKKKEKKIAVRISGPSSIHESTGNVTSGGDGHYAECGFEEATVAAKMKDKIKTKTLSLKRLIRNASKKAKPEEGQYIQCISEPLTDPTFPCLSVGHYSEPLIDAQPVVTASSLGYYSEPITDDKAVALVSGGYYSEIRTTDNGKHQSHSSECSPQADAKAVVLVNTGYYSEIHPTVNAQSGSNPEKIYSEPFVHVLGKKAKSELPSEYKVTNLFQETGPKPSAGGAERYEILNPGRGKEQPHYKSIEDTRRTTTEYVDPDYVDIIDKTGACKKPVVPAKLNYPNTKMGEDGYETAKMGNQSSEYHVTPLYKEDQAKKSSAERLGLYESLRHRQSQDAEKYRALAAPGQDTSLRMKTTTPPGLEDDYVYSVVNKVKRKPPGFDGPVPTAETKES
ncbi:uncharacterized protein LOC127869501 isoform X2 [Dreissena polymorpha]|nr:uncharacterized protein LOC127869501 isoform X2 [Dreissena polymorpha]